MKDYRDRVYQVVADRIDLLSCRPFVFLLRAPSSAHQDRSGAYRLAELYIEPLVADDPRLFRVDAEVACGILDHAWRGLAAAALHAQPRHRTPRVMRTVIQRVEIRAAELQPAPHLVVADVNEGRIDQALGDAGLIGDHDQHIAGPLEQPQGVRRPREELEILEPVQVPDVNVQGAVAINKDGAFQISQDSRPKPQALHIASSTSCEAIFLMQR